MSLVEVTGRGIVLDIEGTVAPIGFVHGTMFEFVRERCDRFVASRWHSEELTSAKLRCRGLVGVRSGNGACLGAATEAAERSVMCGEIRRLMAIDAKDPWLKSVQGLILRSGFESGALRSEFFPDVPAALERWNRAGLSVSTFSSGSVLAQRLFFRHSLQGDLSRLIDAYFDLSVGSKADPEAYRAISERLQIPAMELVFVSDSVRELDAARRSGFTTVMASRPEPGWSAISAPGHNTITSLAEIAVRP